MKKKNTILCVLSLFSLGVVIPLVNANNDIKIHATEADNIFTALGIKENDINESSLLIDPLSPVNASTNKAGLGCQFTFKEQMDVTNSDGFAFRIKNLANQVLQTRLCINTNDKGYTLTNSSVDLYDLNGNKTAAVCGFRFVTIPANFDGVAIVRWNTMVPYRWDGADNWSIATNANKLVKGSEGQTAYPSGKTDKIAFYVEKNANNDHSIVNPFVVSNFYTFVEDESNVEVVKYENPLNIAFSDNLGSCYYPKTASSLLEACNASEDNINDNAICIDPLDPIANTGDKGGIIDLKGNHYIGASDGIALRVKNTAKNTIKTKLYFEIKSGIDGTQSGYSLTGGTIYFYGLDGKVSEYNATSTDRTMVIPSFFDGVIYMPYSSFVPYKYQGTTNWGNATIANKLVKGSTGLTAYPEGRMASLSFYIQKDSAHTTANINPFILNEVYGVSENESSFTVIKHEGAFKASTANGKDNMNVYAYPLAKQTYEFYINGVKTLESDMAKYDLANNDVKLSYGEKLSFNVEALNNVTIQSVTIDDNPISDYSFINYNEEEATHIVNVTTSSETLYEITASYDESQVDISFDDKAYTGPLNIKENSKVVVKVNAKNNYKIANVLVNGEIITLDEDNSFEIDATSNTNIEVISCLDYLEFADFNLINSKLDNTAFVMDPTLTSGANNAGGNILSSKNIELANTTSIALRIKNLEDYDYIIHTLYIQCTDNYSYSLYDSTIRYISLDGTEITTSMSSRQVKIPASFDGYMVIDYNQLIEIKAGGGYFWDKRGSDHLTIDKYPTKKLSFVSFYFPVNNDMAKINELVVGSDVYTISSDNIKQYVNSLSTNKNTLVDSIIVKNYPANTINVKCNNENVTLNKNTFNYANTITITPNTGYTITSAKINDDSFVANEDGSFSLRINKDYGENVVIDVITSQKIYYTIEANYDSTANLLTINGTDYEALSKYEEDSEVTIEVVSYENYVIDSVKVNGEVITLVDNKYTLKITANTVIEIISHLDYNEYSSFAEINSEINEKAMVFDPTLTSGATNDGGHIYLTHPVELANTTSIALRVKNLEDYDYIINTLYLQLTDNYSYSTYNSIIRFISLDGTETTTSMGARQIKVPANFDGYMVIDYNQLVEIKTGGNYFWDKKSDDDKLTLDKYPTKKLSYISIYFPVNNDMAKINELVIGSDVYTITNEAIKGYKELSLANTTIPETINTKYFPVFSKNITCNNENVTLNTNTVSYGDTIIITPNTGYTITSVKLNNIELAKNNDGTYSYKIREELTDDIVLYVEASPCYKVVVMADDNVKVSLDEKEFIVIGNKDIEFSVTLNKGYEVDYVKANGTIINEENGKYTVSIKENVNIDVKTKLTNYTITYNLDGGTNNANNKTTFTINDAFTLLDAYKEGYEFMGWYKLVDGKEVEVTRIVKGSSENLVLYASFKKIDDEKPNDSSTISEEPSSNEETSSNNGNEKPSKGCKSTTLPTLLSLISIIGTLLITKKNKE